MFKPKPQLTLTLPGPSAGVSGSLDSYCSLKPLCSGMGEVVLARTSPTLLPHPLALCCHYPVSKCPSASIAMTGTLRVNSPCQVSNAVAFCANVLQGTTSFTDVIWLQCCKELFIHSVNSDPKEKILKCKTKTKNNWCIKSGAPIEWYFDYIICREFPHLLKFDCVWCHARG